MVLGRPKEVLIFFIAISSGGQIAQGVQFLGALLVLAAFIATLAGRAENGSRPYLATNLIGSGALAVVATVELQFGFILLEGVWAIVSAAALLRRGRSTR